MGDKVYAIVTERIIQSLKNGEVPWHKPWTTSMPISMSTRKAYRGINPLLLNMTAAEKGYSSPFWGTYNQIAELSGMVKNARGKWVSPDEKHRGIRQGETSTLIVFWKIDKRAPRDGEGDKPITFAMLRYFRVFNAEQADELPDRFYPKPNDNIVEPIETAQAVLDEYLIDRGPSLVHGGNEAFYVSGPDRITLPPRNSFKSSNGYYGVAFHEATHSTGHPKRLKRDGVSTFDHFGSERYAKEELVAEIGSAMLRAITGVEVDYDNSGAYVAGWLKAIANDPKLIVKAAAQAQKACDFILGTEFEKDE